MFDRNLYPNTYKAILALFGGILGFFTSIFFLVLYYGINYDMPVPQSVRFNQALWGTIIVVVAVVLVMFHKDVLAAFNAFATEETDEIE